MYALIDPTTTGQYVSSWNEPVAPSTKYTPVFTQIGQRVAYVQENEIPISQPFFWHPCSDDVVADQFYFDPLEQNIFPIPENMVCPTPA